MNWAASKELSAFNQPPQYHIAFVLALCAVHFFTFLGARDFWETETHYGEITRVMLQDGEYWVTRLNGEVWADSPPFYFWLTALVSRAWETVNEWTVRLPSALAATVLVIAFYHFAQKWLGARAAFISTLVMSTAALTIHVERHIPINSTFYLWLATSMFLFMEVITAGEPQPRRAYGAWFFLGLACLTKAPISVVLPLSVIGLFALGTRSWKKMLWLRPISGPLLLILVLSPWLFFALWKTSGRWVDYFFAQHHVLYNFSHRQPWFYAGGVLSDRLCTVGFSAAAGGSESMGRARRPGRTQIFIPVDLVANRPGSRAVVRRSSQPLPFHRGGAGSTRGGSLRRSAGERQRECASAFLGPCKPQGGVRAFVCLRPGGANPGMAPVA
jgi:4-amino-4-deoxy-L-arabinose transferase-like glycosyltransferase